MNNERAKSEINVRIVCLLLLSATLLTVEEIKQMKAKKRYTLRIYNNTAAMKLQRCLCGK